MFRSFENQLKVQKLTFWTDFYLIIITLPAISKKPYTYLLLMRESLEFYHFFFLVNSGATSKVTVHVFILSCAFCQV